MAVLGPTAGKLDIVIEQGATFRPVFLWTDSGKVPRDLTGYSAKFQVRTHAESATALLTLSSDDGTLVLGGVEGTITFALSAAQTRDLTFQSGVYQLELVHGDTVVRLLEGWVRVSREVVRDA